MTKKTTPTPAQGMKVPSGVHAMRRGGARREVTERVSLKSKDGETLDGWALNVSRGGLRAILEEKIVLGQTFDVAIGTDVTYASNPPSSGPHYPIWAAFQEFPDPVDRRYYVHDLEHGAIVLLYNCAALPDGGAAIADGGDGGTACDALREGLRKAAASIPADPLCANTPGVRVRYVMTPDPLITGPIAASGWGFTYNAACVDIPTLIDFANKHYGQGTEPVCANGTTTF